MSARSVGRVALIAVVVGLIAVIGEASGVAPAWAVLIGVAVSITGAPPVAPRGVTAVATGAAAVVALWALAVVGLSSELAAAATAGLVVAGAGLARLRDDPRVPALAVLLGGGTVLAGARVVGGTGVAEVAPALAGLVAGLLPMQVGEVITGLRDARNVSEVATYGRDGVATGRPDTPQPGPPDGGDDPSTVRDGVGRVRVIDHGDGTRDLGADGNRGVDS